MRKTATLWISGIPDGSANRDDLAKRFAAFGTVEDVRVVSQSNGWCDPGQPRGFAFVDIVPLHTAQARAPMTPGEVMSARQEEDDTKAGNLTAVFRALNGAKWRGSTLRVQLARPGYIDRYFGVSNHSHAGIVSRSSGDEDGDEASVVRESDDDDAGKERSSHEVSCPPVLRILTPKGTAMRVPFHGGARGQSHVRFDSDDEEHGEQNGIGSGVRPNSEIFESMWTVEAEAKGEMRDAFELPAKAMTADAMVAKSAMDGDADNIMVDFGDTSDLDDDDQDDVGEKPFLLSKRGDAADRSPFTAERSVASDDAMMDLDETSDANEEGWSVRFHEGSNVVRLDEASNVDEDVAGLAMYTAEVDTATEGTHRDILASSRVDQMGIFSSTAKGQHGGDGEDEEESGFEEDADVGEDDDDVEGKPADNEEDESVCNALVRCKDDCHEDIVTKDGATIPKGRAGCGLGPAELREERRKQSEEKRSSAVEELARPRIVGAIINSTISERHVFPDSEGEEGTDDITVVGEGTTSSKNYMKPSKLHLDLDDDDNDSTDYKSQDKEEKDGFTIKPQFEGEAGQRLFRMQNRHSGDARFKMDERFLDGEAGEGISESEARAVDTNDTVDDSTTSGDKIGGASTADAAQEKAKSLEILAGLLGSSVGNVGTSEEASTIDGDSFFAQQVTVVDHFREQQQHRQRVPLVWKAPVHYDPTADNAADWEEDVLTGDGSSGSLLEENDEARVGHADQETRKKYKTERANTVAKKLTAAAAAPQAIVVNTNLRSLVFGHSEPKETTDGDRGMLLFGDDKSHADAPVSLVDDLVSTAKREVHSFGLFNEGGEGRGGGEFRLFDRPHNASVGGTLVDSAAFARTSIDTAPTATIIGAESGSTKIKEAAAKSAAQRASRPVVKRRRRSAAAFLKPRSGTSMQEDWEAKREWGINAYKARRKTAVKHARRKGA